MKINQAYVIRDVFGKMILMPYLSTKVGNKPIYINDTGRNVIMMLNQSHNIEELCKNVADLYSIKEGSKEYGMIQDFVQNLMELEIIVEGV